MHLQMDFWEYGFLGFRRKQIESEPETFMNNRFKGILKKLGSYFMGGLLAILPIVLTVAIAARLGR